jgi:outer membrane protein OmpA-like peptidoglycan-associated protein
VGAAARHIPRLVAFAALAATGQLTVGAQPQVAHIVLEAPEPTPETFGDEADFPFLSRIGGTSLIKTTRVNEPLEVKPASADTEAILAGTSFVQKSYSAPLNVWDLAFVTPYRDAMLLRGWRILDEPPATAAENEPHVINLSAHYATGGRDLYARLSRTPDGSYQISVADVGAEDWAAMLDRACRIPIFSIHFKHDLTLYYEDSRPTLEKLAAIIRATRGGEFEIQGHTDNVGDEKELLAQSMRRAAMVNVSLVGLGVPRDRLSVKGFGKSRPLVPNDTDWGRTKNRRIEIEKKGCTATPSTRPDKPRRSGV